jgi:hypothetical protein
MATLTTIRDRIEQMLEDVSNTTWPTAELDEAIRRALEEYNQAIPLQAVAVVTLTAGGRQQDVSAVTGILRPVEVWLPYTAADPEFPPNRRRFRWWRDQLKLYLADGHEPQAGDVMRLFYYMQRTINGLDGATATTVHAEDELLIVTGGAGHAAVQRAVGVVEGINVHGYVTLNLHTWGQQRLDEFRDGLASAAAREAPLSAVVEGWGEDGR